MTDKYYARFHVKHSDSVILFEESLQKLRSSYRWNFCKEKTDWVLMTKMEEINTHGGESVLLHLDDWEHCNELSEDPVGKQNFLWGSPKSKNIDYKVEHPVFSKIKMVNLPFHILISSQNLRIWSRVFFCRNYQML